MQVSVSVEAYSQSGAEIIARDAVGECDVDRIMCVECIEDDF